jgi:sn-glycerol 3-phosphate transport system substrate-binding protein
MTADTSAALGTVLSVLPQFPGVELGVAPLPGLPGDGATFVGGGANYIVKGDDPAKIEAAWLFAKYLDEPETQATWAQTGYIPIRQDAVDTPELQQLWTSQPFYKVAFDQLAADNTTVAAKGPVIGAFTGVRDAETDAMEEMVTNGIAPDDALADAAKNSNDAISEYNERAGVG